MKIRILSVAGFKILIQSEGETGICLEEGYLPFEIQNDGCLPDLTINVVKGIPPLLIPTDKPIFEAGDSSKKYFSVYKNVNEYKFVVYGALNSNKIQQVALLNNNLTEWTIFTGKTDRAGITMPLHYPMGPLIFYYLTVKFKAVMIHASGVFADNIGRVFTGFSGSGKSTLAGLWLNAGGLILNDDRIVIKKEDDGYYMYNTPMLYPDVPKKSSLEYLFIIDHSKENTINRLIGADSVCHLMAFCIQHGYCRSFIEHHLEFLSNLCKCLPVYSLGFVPDGTIIDFINRYGI